MSQAKEAHVICKVATCCRVDHLHPKPLSPSPPHRYTLGHPFSKCSPRTPEHPLDNISRQTACRSRCENPAVFYEDRHCRDLQKCKTKPLFLLHLFFALENKVIFQEKNCTIYVNMQAIYCCYFKMN